MTFFNNPSSSLLEVTAIYGSELFGVPALFVVPRRTSPRALHAHVAAALGQQPKCRPPAGSMAAGSGGVGDGAAETEAYAFEVCVFVCVCVCVWVCVCVCGSNPRVRKLQRSCLVAAEGRSRRDGRTAATFSFGMA